MKKLIAALFLIGILFLCMTVFDVLKADLFFEAKIVIGAMGVFAILGAVYLTVQEYKDHRKMRV